MPRFRYGVTLFREMVGLAREHKAYWIVPLVLVLGLAAFVIVAGQTAAPLLYTLF
ncbi:MAG: DUF5989 family protein [Myxococcota bacterium]